MPKNIPSFFGDVFFKLKRSGKHENKNYDHRINYFICLYVFGILWSETKETKKKSRTSTRAKI